MKNLFVIAAIAALFITGPALAQKVETVKQERQSPQPEDKPDVRR